MAPRGFGRLAPDVAQPKAPFTLTVDLAEEMLSPRWWRGASTLAAMVACLSLLAPAPEPLLDDGEPVGSDQAQGLADLGVSPASSGSRSGGRMAASPAVEPLLEAPERAQVDLSIRLGAGDRLGAMLMRIGAQSSDAAKVAGLIAAHAHGPLPAGTAIAIRMGRKGAAGLRPIERVALRAGLSLDLVIEADTSGGFSAVATPIATDNRPRRIRGAVGDGLYWSLRAAGVEPGTAGDYLKALATQIDVGADLAPADRFDLIVANRRASTGENEVGPLLYAGNERMGGRPIQLLKWSVGGKSDWYEAGSLRQVSTAFAWPVNAPVTSNFGMRYHPILHFARMHRGMDFGARWGSPITASADGQVTRAGWAGGYGQQVRIAHSGGIATSYSHMSRMVVEPGMLVRQGQLIGYVGTTGLSTGPHLHYETYRNGVAVNPRSVQFAAAPVADSGALAAFRARLRSLLTKAKG